MKTINLPPELYNRPMMNCGQKSPRIMSEITQKQIDEVAAVMGEQEVFIVELTKRQLDLIAAAVRREITSSQACFWHNVGRHDDLAVQFTNSINEQKELLKAIGRPF